MNDQAVTIERGFAEGELVVLRPVKESDLLPLAQLMAECPYENEPIPWTYQRLKQKFEDKEKPGLWDQDSRIYTVLRKSGGVVGFIREATHAGEMYWCGLHLAESAADRDELGTELVAIYLRYKRHWHKPRRISFVLLRLETQKSNWLATSGFEEELVFHDAAFYRGKPAAIAYLTWIADWALALRAESQPVPGEDNPRSS
jgi:hypothetical protein